MTKVDRLLTELGYAAEGGDLDEVKRLMTEIGKSPFIGERQKMHGIPFEKAAQHGRLDIVKHFLQGNPFAKQRSDALSSAAANGHIDIVQSIMTYKDDIPAWALTDALNVAVMRKHVDIVDHLLLSTAVPNEIVFESVVTVYDGGDTRILKSLLGHTSWAPTADDLEDALVRAARGGHSDFVDLLLVRIKAEAAALSKAWEAAAMSGHFGIVNKILEYRNARGHGPRITYTEALKNALLACGRDEREYWVHPDKITEELNENKRRVSVLAYTSWPRDVVRTIVGLIL
ncbi:hypothetical protein TSOC_014390 [Tetrabaena socialis]|uniref:Ankyrin repeat domain-containing protein n=1 Tax=Tetrabaena socialis TaxID=47790 RepID=A0A2J7ZHS5_9CHLO|nr:hypothetical protein TSOC_014390 [Tetrabaena socialis]|eukprot:PNG99820.1 hypothetical protein TSOC_014390 [Tetrabaena socialis]